MEKGGYWQRDMPFVVKRSDLKVERRPHLPHGGDEAGRPDSLEIDGQLALEMNDPAPLSGKGNDRFGFSSWATIPTSTTSGSRAL